MHLKLSHLSAALLACALAVVLLSCGEDDPARPTEAFSFDLAVTDTLGNPVSGLEVSVWNRLSIEPAGLLPRRADEAARAASNASTVISFGVETRSSVRVHVYDLNGGIVDSLLRPTETPPGEHKIVWNAASNVPNGVYGYRMQATDSTGVVLFEDKNYCVLARTERSYGVIGYTDADGSLRSEDARLFPGHMDLPPMTATNAVGQDVGALEVLDSVRVTVVDTTSMLGVSVDCVVGPGGNAIDILWESPVPLQQLPTAAAGVSVAAPLGDPAAPEPLPIQWSLRQNYPNPFN